VLGRGTLLAQQIDVNELERRFTDHRAGQRDHGYALWSAWVLERWLEGTRGRDRRPSRTGPYEKAVS
jgi:hypothetical protein